MILNKSQRILYIIYSILPEWSLKYRYKTQKMGASLVAQWLGVRLPMQGTRGRALVWEDPTCRGATGPVSHDC